MMQSLVNAFSGLVCTYCNCSIFTSSSMRLNKNAYNEHIESAKHHKALIEYYGADSCTHIQNKNDYNKFISDYIKSEKCQDDYYNKILPQYKISCQNHALVISSLFDSNDKSYIDDFMDSEVRKVKQCDSCNKVFDPTLKSRNKTCRKHYNICVPSTRKLLSKEGRYVKHRFPSYGKFISDYDNISIQQLIKDETFCKDVMVYVNENLMYYTHQHQEALVIPPDLGSSSLTHIGGIATLALQQQQLIMQWIEDPNIVGYMSINGKRLEIFFDFNITGRPNAETLWTKLVSFYIHNNSLDIKHGTITNSIKVYCQQQTDKDIRLSSMYDDIKIGNAGVEKKFGNFSMIVTFGSCSQQILHIDALLPNYQFILSCTNNSPVTLFNPVAKDSNIILVQQLENGFLNDIDKDLLLMMQSHKGVEDLVYDYGNLFTLTSVTNTNSTVDNPMTAELGTVVSLPGSVIHAGPSCNEARAIIFYTCGFIWGKRKRNDSEKDDDKRTRNRMFRKRDLYSKFEQYSVVTLFIEMLCKVWVKLTIPSHKEYLLTKLHELILAQKFVHEQHGPSNTYIPMLDTFLMQCRKKTLAKKVMKQVVDSNTLLIE